MKGELKFRIILQFFPEKIEHASVSSWLDEAPIQNLYEKEARFAKEMRKKLCHKKGHQIDFKCEWIP